MDLVAWLYEFFRSRWDIRIISANIVYKVSQKLEEVLPSLFCWFGADKYSILEFIGVELFLVGVHEIQL